jgi:hypothetical protein
VPEINPTVRARVGTRRRHGRDDLGRAREWTLPHAAPLTRSDQAIAVVIRLR